MKKIIAILMTLIMMLSMVACSKSSDIAMNVDNMKWEEILEESKGSTVTFYGWGGDEDLNAWLDNVFAPKMKEKYDFSYNADGGNKSNGVLGSYIEALNLAKKGKECFEYVFDIQHYQHISD